MLRAKRGLTFSLAAGVAHNRETPGLLEKNGPGCGEAILPTGNRSFTRTAKWKRSRMGHHRPTSLLTILPCSGSGFVARATTVGAECPTTWAGREKLRT